ncbi:MAG: glycoside hydrolase family 3 N-terminal domain-containing protein [Bacteroidales bacterium]
MKKTILAALSLLLASSSINAKTPTLMSVADNPAMEAWVDSVFNELSDDEKIGQLFVPVIAPDGSAYSKKLAKRYVKDYGAGGLLISTGTIANHAELNNYAQSESKVPLMITIDGEWSVSMRMTDADEFPRNMTLGAISDDKLLYEYGQETARQCRRMGINVDFSPVMDVNTNPKNPVIGNRSFGELECEVTRKGIAYSKGLEDGGVMSVAKHFPGHGDTHEDSHKTLPVLDKSMVELQLVDLKPFKEYINAGLSGMLVGHLSVPAMGTDGEPTSLSKGVVTDYLCEKMGFEGLIFTDALAMKGVNTDGSPSVKSLLAGNDILLSPGKFEDEFKAVKKAIKSGIISDSIIDAKCKKVLRYKYILGVNNRQPIEVTNMVEDINSAKADALMRKLWSASITVVNNKNNALPLVDLDMNKVAVVTLGDDANEFYNTCKLYCGADRLSADDINAATLQKYGTVIVSIHSTKDDYSATLNKIANSDCDVIATFFISPYRVWKYQSALEKDNVSTIMAYENVELAQSYAAQAIFGGNDVSGVLPVSINGLAKAGSGVNYKATRLGYSAPEIVGMDDTIVAFVDSIVNVGLETGAFPGCQVLIAHKGKIVINKAYGYMESEKENPTTEYSIYDLASVSKASGTLPGIMKAYDMGLFKLDEKASKYIPGLRGLEGKEDITIEELLYHESGIEPALNMYEVMLDSTSFEQPLFKKRKSSSHPIYVSKGNYGNKDAKLRTDIVSDKQSDEFPIQVSTDIYASKVAIDTIMSRIYNLPLRKDKSFAYSCLNFCLLMDLEQRVTNESHDDFLYENIYRPLGASITGYNPLERFNKNQIVATEYDNLVRKEHVRGNVHDELAAFSGGLQGNAGLFSNANDIAKMCQMLLNMGEYGGEELLSKETVRVFMESKSPTCRRGLGFDKPDMLNPEKSPTAPEASAATIGHIGFTGTCFWVDPESELIYIFLSNRVDPTRSSDAFYEMNIRPDILSAAYHAIGK